MKLARRKPGAFIKPVLDYSILMIIPLLDMLVIQYFSAAISVRHLEVLVMSAYLGLVFSAVSSAIGDTLLVIINIDPRKNLVRRFASGGILFFVLVSGLAWGLLFLLKMPIASFLKLENFENLDEIYLLRTSSGFLMSLLNIGFFIMAALEHRQKIIYISIFSLAFNFTTNAAAMFFELGDSSRFRVLCYSILVARLLSLALMLRFVTPFLQLQWRHVLDFIARGKQLMVGEFFEGMVSLSVPLLFLKAIDYAYGGEGIAAFSVAQTTFGILAILIGSIQMSGVTWLTDIWSFRGEPEWRHSLWSIKKYTLGIVGLPLVLIMICGSYILSNFYNIRSAEGLTIATLTFASMIPMIFTVDISCLIKVLEKQHLKSVIEMVLSTVIGLSTIFLFGRHLPVWLGLSIGLVLPQVLLSVWMYFQAKNLNGQLEKLATENSRQI